MLMFIRYFKRQFIEGTISISPPAIFNNISPIQQKLHAENPNLRLNEYPHKKERTNSCL